MSESIRDRVIRLIQEMRNRTTERGATPAEAAGFAAKIAEWVEKYNIEEAELRARGDTATPEEIKVCQGTIPTGKKVFNPGVTRLVSGLATGMCCKVILTYSRNEAVYGIVGEQLDADYVCQLVPILLGQLKTMAALEGWENGYEKAGLIRWTNQYLTGAGQAIQQRLEQDRKDRSEVKQMEHSLAPAGSGALVCITGESIAVAKREAVAREFKRMYPKTHKTYSNAGYDNTAQERGREAGQRVGLNLGIKD